MTIVAGSGDTIDTAVSIMDLADAVCRDSRLRDRVCFIQTFNKFKDHGVGLDTPAVRDLWAYPALQDERIGQLFSKILGRDDAHAVTYNWTNVPSKSAAMNGIMLVPEMASIRVFHILDRNANALEVDKVMADYLRMLKHPELVILAGMRNTSNTIEPIGRQSEAIEGGHGAALLAVPDKIGTGWANLAAVPFWQVFAALSHPNYPVLRLSAADSAPATDARYYGLAGFEPNGIGQSEDLWSVFQQTHNLIGLGAVPEFGVTTSSAVKLRERRSAFAVSTAGSRWSGGLVDALRSPIQQMIGCFGPESIFERKARRNVERVYLTAPVGVFSMAFIFVSIFLDMNPFIGIQMLFWSVAILFSQALTLHGLVASCRARGTWLGKWVVGAAAAAAGVVLLLPAFLPVGLVVLPVAVVILAAGGMLYSPAGFSWWLQSRLRDVILFAPRYFMEAAAVIVRLAGGDHGFSVSGRGDDADTHTGWQRLKQLIWGGPAVNAVIPAWLGLPSTVTAIVVAAVTAALLFSSRWVRDNHGFAPWFVLACVPVIAAGSLLNSHRRKREANWYWPWVAFVLSLAIGAEALLFSSLNLDFGNIILMWIILAFAAGAVTGFFTGDQRPGKHDNIWSPLSTLAGTAWGIAAVCFLHFALKPSLDSHWVASLLLRLTILLPAVSYFVGPLAGGTGRKPASGAQTDNTTVTPNISHRTVKDRVISNFRRACYDTLATFGWFGIVPIPNNIRFALVPQAFYVATIGQIAFLGSAGLMAIAIMSALGKWRSSILRKQLWSRFEIAAKDHYTNLIRPNGVRDARTARDGALIMQFLVKMGTGHWAYAEEALNGMNRAPHCADGVAGRAIPAGAGND